MKLNRISVLFIVFIFLFLENTNAQKILTVQLKTEYNYFSMTDLKDLQNESVLKLRNNGINASAVGSFPAYYGFQLRLGLPVIFPNINNFDCGFLFDYSSTGGRVNYEDYSGEINFDQILRLYSFGAFIEKSFPRNEEFSYKLGGSIQLILGSLDFDFLTRIGKHSDTENYNMDCVSLGFEPNVGATYTKYGVSIGFNIGLMIAIPSGFTLSTNSNAILQKSNGDNVSLGMNGFRLGLTAGYGF